MAAIRRGGVDDLDAIDRIQAASPEASHWAVREYLNYDLWVAETTPQGVAGFLVSRPLGAGEGELLNIAVAPESRRSGVATALVRRFLEGFPAGAWLEVRESNEAALNLYKSMGFQEVNRRPAYYSSPSETAIVMKFHSC
jgi:ribosomal-protein-alanine N-acetyltransferase